MSHMRRNFTFNYNSPSEWFTEPLTISNTTWHILQRLRPYFQHFDPPKLRSQMLWRYICYIITPPTMTVCHHVYPFNQHKLPSNVNFCTSIIYRPIYTAKKLNSRKKLFFLTANVLILFISCTISLFYNVRLAVFNWSCCSKIKHIVSRTQ